MKKMLYTWLLILVVLNERCCSKQTGGSSTRNHHPCFLFGIDERKLSDAAKICGGAENVVKTETQQLNSWQMDCSVLLL